MIIQTSSFKRKMENMELRFEIIVHLTTSMKLNIYILMREKLMDELKISEVLYEPIMERIFMK